MQTDVTTETASRKQLTASLVSIDVDAIHNLPARLDDDVMTQLRTIARTALPVLAPADDTQFAKCLKLLDVLPKRADDAVTGTLRFNLYRRHFGHYSAEALFHLAQEATLTLRFFPSPMECKAILDAWERNDPASRAKVLAESRVRREMEARFDETMVQLKARSLTQAQVDALPKSWKLHAEERGFVRYGSEGSFPIRHEPQ